MSKLNLKKKIKMTKKELIFYQEKDIYIKYISSKIISDPILFYNTTNEFYKISLKFSKLLKERLQKKIIIKLLINKYNIY